MFPSPVERFFYKDSAGFCSLKRFESENNVTTIEELIAAIQSCYKSQFLDIALEVSLEKAKEIILEMPTEEEIQYIIGFLKNIDYRQTDVTDITAIIEEDAAAFFEGEKTAQQVADTIQSRVKIFISEQR